jgi:hypothetical protein
MHSPSPNGSRLGLDFLSVERCQSVCSTQATIRLWAPAPGVLVTQVDGFLTIEGAMAIGHHFHQENTSGRRLVAFHDWKGMTDYNDVARAYLLDIVRGFSQQFEAIHILVRSPVVEFGVRVANLTVKSLQVYSARAEFEVALREALRSHGKGGKERATNGKSTAEKRTPSGD